MVPIGQWVLGQACHQAQAWQEIGLAPIRIAVNISAVELHAKKFSKGVGVILAATGLFSPAIALLGVFAVLFYGSLIIVLNLLVDLAYAFLDPRPRVRT